MENEILNTTPNPDGEVPEEETLNFTDKAIGVFTEPGKVFTDISTKPLKNMDWLLPTIIMIFIVIASQIVMMNNPTIKQDMKEQQVKGMQKMVDEGKMTQEQFEQAQDQMDKMSGFMYIGIFVGVPIFSFIVIFVMALVYWLLAKFGLRGDPSFMTVLTIYCMTAFIGIVEVLFTTIVAIMVGKAQVSFSLGLLFSNMAEGPVRTLFNKINPFTFWSLAVLGIGLAKATKKDSLSGIYWVLGLWLVFTLLSVFVLSKISFLSFLAK